jgi:RNA-binding protein YhbY
MGGITGSTLGMQRVIKELLKVPSRIAGKVAGRIDQRIQDQYANETDAYGKRLAPLKAATLVRKRGNNVIHYRTGKQRAQIRVSAMRGAGIKITYGDTAIWSHMGGAHRVARSIAPTGPVPKTWAADIRAEAEADAARVAKGAK